MKKQNLLYSTLIMVCLSGNNQLIISENLQSNININDYTLVWQDEFNGTILNTSKWNYRAEGTVRGNATVSRKTIAMDGLGHVIISTTRDSNGEYYVGELGTQGIFETTYGYFECRAKMNEQVGPHISFWLQSPTINTVGNPAINGTEIDVFEYHRKTPTTVYHNLHWDGYGSYHQTTGTQLTWPGIDTGFHTFGLLWTKDSYTFYVDGVQTWQTTTAVSQRSEYLILSTELTGWGGDPSTSIFPDDFIVDYVRVYKPKDISALSNSVHTSNIQIQPCMVKSGEDLTISMPLYKGKVSVNIYNTEGRLLRDFEAIPESSSEIKINSTGLKSGVYILRCNNLIGKFVVN